jgi:hypothetical protein
VCDVNIPVAVLSRQIIADGSETDTGDLIVTQSL